ncbi:MAG TPA: hypothetical protein VH165_37540, partial [Kofleriaceae bacterium]|nr:hypothetical protein [Kofleriaceae bacterium]
SGGNRWSLSATVGIARIGGKTRTVTVDDLHTQERIPPRGKDASPSGLVIDLLLDDKKVLLRHSSEGGSDVDYAVDLDKCSFPRAGDGVLAGLVPPPPEPVGCAPATVKGPYRTQVGLVAKLADADADREAQALCEDHQKTIEARGKLDQVLTDRAARARIAARGAALLRTEDARDKAWSRVDGCPTVDLDKAKGTAALHDGEAKLRACYGQIAAKP